MLRHRHHISRLCNRELRLTAELGPGHDALPDSQPGNALPDRLDLTGHLIAQDARRLRRGGVQTHPRHGVSEVETCRVHRDPNLTGSDIRVRSFHNLEHPGPTGAGQHNSLHGRNLRAAAAGPRAALRHGPSLTHCLVGSPAGEPAITQPEQA